MCDTKNKIDRIPVFPVFLAEIVGKDDDNAELTFEAFNRQLDFPDEPHQRDESPQNIIDVLGYGWVQE
jgi:hypothetical protein